MWRCTDSSTAAPLLDRFGEQLGDVVTLHARAYRPRRVLVEQVAQPLAAPVQAHLGRRHRDAELLGDLLVRQAVDVLQHDEHPQLRRQVLERAGRAGPAAADCSADSSGWASMRVSTGSSSMASSDVGRGAADAA